ncbi:uncharacterized protein FFFS_06570 [Fusarium fujikuroi]|nr:uncharacterized protein FFFS_06570 [Fusarium fujikuroi]
MSILENPRPIPQSLANPLGIPVFSPTVWLCPTSSAGKLIGRPDRYWLNLAAGALPDKDKKEKAAVEVKKFLLNFHAGRVVVDEVHFAKTPRLMLNQMIQMMSYDELYLAFAMMLLNSICDFFGYVELLWRDELHSGSHSL